MIAIQTKHLGLAPSNARLLSPQGSATDLLVESNALELMGSVFEYFRGYAHCVAADELPRPRLTILVSDQEFKLHTTRDIGVIARALPKMRVHAKQGRATRTGLVYLDPVSMDALLLLPAGAGGYELIAMRAARAMLASSLIATGAVPLHAACFAGAQATCLIGDKHMGKTTILLASLLDGGVDMVANDKVFVRCEGQVRVEALPVSAAIRPATVEMFSELRVAAAAANDMHWENSPAPGRRHTTADRLYVPPNDLVRLLSCDVRASAPLGLIIALRYDSTAPAPRMTRLLGEEAAAALSSAYLSNWFPEEPLWESLAAERPSLARHRHALALRDLSTRVPVYELLHGPRAGPITDVVRIVKSLAAKQRSCSQESRQPPARA